MVSDLDLSGHKYHGHRNHIRRGAWRGGLAGRAQRPGNGGGGRHFSAAACFAADGGRIFLLLLLGRNGPIGKLLLQFGATVVFSWPATVIAAAVVAFPLMYLTARAALEQVDPQFVQAARTLGATEWRVFREVALPLAWPGVLAGTILSFARALGEFGATLMVAGNIPGKTATIPIAIYFAVEADDTARALAWCGVDVVISLALLAGLYYWTHGQGPGRARWARR